MIKICIWRSKDRERKALYSIANFQNYKPIIISENTTSKERENWARY
jgi:hypothetical protein